MEYDDLAKIENLVHNLWDAAALFCLDQQSLRYTELHRDMVTWGGRHLSESELTRTRHRLVRKMIKVSSGKDGHNVYSITDAGRARLAQIRILIQIEPRLESPDDDKKPTDDETPNDSR